MSVKADELVLLYEKLTSNLSDMLEPQVAPSDPSLLSLLRTQKAAAEAHRTFFIAESHARIDQLPEAAALLQRAEERIQRATEQRPKTTDPSLDAEAAAVLAQLSRLSGRVRSQLLVLRAKAAVQRVSEEREAQRGVSLLSLKDGPRSGLSKADSASASTASSAFTSATGPLLSRVDSFSVGPASAQFGLTDWPPAYAAVPCKPVLFDLAFNAIEYPDIGGGGKEKGKAEAAKVDEEEAGEEEVEGKEEPAPAESQQSKAGGLLGAVGGAVGGLGKWVWRR